MLGRSHNPYFTNTFRVGPGGSRQCVPLAAMVPVVSLLTGTFLPIAASALLHWMFFSVAYYFVLLQGNRPYTLLMLKYWVAHFFTNYTALHRAIASRKGKAPYKVTAKSRTAGFYAR